MSKETFLRYSHNEHGNEIRKQKSTKFSRKWGIHAIDLAEQEQISPDAIHCRVRNFGTPFMRRPQPTKCEEMTGFTLFQLATILDVHPFTIDGRINKYNNPFVVIYDMSEDHKSRSYKGNVHWSKQPLFRDNIRGWKSWIMPQHPDWAEWKEQKRQDCERLKTEAVIIKQDYLKAQEKARQENI